ncbi:meiosis-specific coiled-coil domain-containing protein MEIOC [Polymixia lowei]
MDTYTPQSQKLPKPPGLPMPSMGNSYLSNIKQSQHDYISPEKDSGNSGSLNNFPDLNDSFAPQSKMSSQCFDPDYGDHFNQGSVNPISNKQYAPQEVNKLVSNLQALVTGEQHSHQRGPLCTQDYSHGNRPTVHCGPGQGYVGMGPDSIRKGDGDSEMQLDKNRVHKAGFVAEAFSTHGLNGNARPQTSTHIREGDMRHGFLQNSYFDLPGVVYNSQRFGGGNGTVSVGKTPQFLPVMYPLRDPRQSSCQISFNSSKFSSRSAPPYGSGVPPMGDIMPDTEFTVFNPYVSDLMGCSSENIYPGMASILRSPRMVKNRGGSMSQFHFYLDQCYEQWRCLEKERKKMEGILTKTFPGKRISTVTSKSLPKMPPNPSRVDRLIIDQIKEQARVVSLLVKMERLSSIPLHANSTSALDQHYEAICVTQARRKEEFVNTSNYQRQGGAQFREDGDILLLVIALKELCAATRKSCTTLWCALQMTIPTSVWTLEDNVDSQAPCEQSSPEKRVLSF